MLDGNSIRNDDGLVLCAVWAGSSWLGLDVLDDSSRGRRRRGLARFYRPDYFGAFPPWTYAFAPGTRIEDVQLAGHLGPPLPPPRAVHEAIFSLTLRCLFADGIPSSPFHQRPDSERNRTADYDRERGLAYPLLGLVEDGKAPLPSKTGGAAAARSRDPQLVKWQPVSAEIHL